MYETPVLEPGAVLLGTEAHFSIHQQYFHKTVILLLQHDESFTLGVIVNRPSAHKIDGWPVWCGGDVSEGGLFKGETRLKEKIAAAQTGMAVICVHRVDNDKAREASACVMGDVYWCSFDAARAMVEAGVATKEDFWTFVGYAGWGPNQLQGELERKSWYLASADSTVLLDELIALSNDPLTIPRIDPDSGELLEGGDGLETWERVAAKIGRASGPDAPQTLMDRMLREWVRANLVPFSPSTNRATTPSSPSELMKRAQETGIPADQLVPDVERGQFLVTTKPHALDDQYLNHAIMVVWETDQSGVVVGVLNRPTASIVELNLPGSEEGRNRRRLSLGGDKVIAPPVNMLPLAYRDDVGCTEMGPGTGIYVLLESKAFTGQASDLLCLRSLHKYGYGELKRELMEGTVAVVKREDVPVEELWKLSDPDAGAASSLQERIDEQRAAEEGVDGALDARLSRLQKAGTALWHDTVEASGVEVPTPATPTLPELADEALLEWVKVFGSTYG